jgi:hypothetical protein
MRPVVDTNVFVSAALKQGSLPSLALYQVSERCVFLKSTATEAQFFEVMTRSYLAPLIATDARDWLSVRPGTFFAFSNGSCGRLGRCGRSPMSPHRPRGRACQTTHRNRLKRRTKFRDGHGRS